jgi:manganese/zinc/iron transport system permease protein
LESFIYGNTASMTTQDAQFVFVSALVLLLLCGGLFKEFSLLCFDEAFACAAGWPVKILDVLLMGAVVLVTVIGLQSVGILLVVALLVIPPAAARFWTDNLGTMAVISSLIGAASALAGVMISAMFPKMPTGALIVLAATCLFAWGFLAGTRRGLLTRWLAERRAEQRLHSEHMLRAIFECAECIGPVVKHSDILAKRPWEKSEVIRNIFQLAESGLVTASPEGQTVQLTGRGEIEARRLVRNHRLWELYLLNHADVAPARVDRDADLIEHVLDPRLVEELEYLLTKETHTNFVPPDPEKLPA